MNVPEGASLEIAVAACRDAARAVTAGHRKGRNGELWRVLGMVLGICERCDDTEERSELSRIFREKPLLGRNRKFVERGSDLYTEVCRYVFDGETNHANMSRYATCLREAGKAGVRSDGFVKFLGENGGLNKLWYGSRRNDLSIKTKCLRLSEAITVPPSGEFTVTLRRLQDNSYEPIGFVGKE